MVAYSFRPQFVSPILRGTKRQTIRAERKRHARPREAIQLYTGMRTKACRAIGVATCEVAVPVLLSFGADPAVWLSGDGPLRGDFLEAFARADGFEDWPAMREFWRASHGNASTFSGILIRWSDLRPAR